VLPLHADIVPLSGTGLPTRFALRRRSSQAARYGRLCKPGLR
jgi:hypothetical protein